MESTSLDFNRLGCSGVAEILDCYVRHLARFDVTPLGFCACNLTRQPYLIRVENILPSTHKFLLILLLLLLLLLLSLLLLLRFNCLTNLNFNFFLGRDINIFITYIRSR
jgi:hypothetical protein